MVLGKKKLKRRLVCVGFCVRIKYVCSFVHKGFNRIKLIAPIQPHTPKKIEKPYDLLFFASAIILLIAVLSVVRIIIGN